VRPPRITDEIADTEEGVAFLELLKVIDFLGLKEAITYRKFICGYEYYGSTHEDGWLYDGFSKPKLM
jgi:hypothetical protein